MTTIAIIIPFYNEENSLAILLKELKLSCESISQIHAVKFRIIFVDDGSIDNSAKVINSHRNFSIPIQLITLSRNFGKEAAITVGLEKGKDNEAVLIMDSDLQHPPSVIKELVEKFMTDEYEMVYAFKKNRDRESYLIQLLSRLFYFLINKNNRYKIPKNAGDFRILSKKVVNAILQLPENERFMKGLYAWVGYRVEGIPYTPPKRSHGNSFYTRWQLLVLSIDGITSFSVTPLRMMSVFGLFISCLSTVYFVFIILQRLLMNTTPPGLASIFVLVSFFGGVQLLCFGIIGEYIGKILIETKRRPSYIIQDDVTVSEGIDV